MNVYKLDSGEPVLRLWAKVDSATGLWHPLICHLIETAAVASLIWDEVLVPCTRKIIADSLGLSIEAARQWTVFLVGAHDLGKASPPFQRKWEPCIPKLESLGYRFTSLDELRHGTVTAQIMAESLKERGLNIKVANELAKAIGGHHGVFDTASGMLRPAPRAIGEGLWIVSRNWIIEWLAGQLELQGLPQKADLPGITLLAGLTTVSDWIASSVDHFPYAPELLDHPNRIHSLLSDSKSKATAALDKLGWRTQLHFPNPLNFQSFFEMPHPRPLQIASIKAANELGSPSLVIVEAPMGEGKTEAALFLTERLRQIHDLRGAYIGLPTQATSNQMFERVVKALAHGASEGVAHILLLHGHAALSSEFEELKKQSLSGFHPSSIEEDGSFDAKVLAGEWFTYKKRGLLAPYGVGTVDQALMAALQSKHVFVRLLGFSGKVVVIDEVHAYDTYMSALLVRLLEWLRAIGTSVVMLSATLPGARRAALLKAFKPDYEMPMETYPYPCLTTVSGAEVQLTSFAAAAPEKRVQLVPAPSEAADLASWLFERIKDGGCAAIVCNTVARAQEIFEACSKAMPGDAEDASPIVDLLHSRFPFEEREAREQRTLKRFGKPGDSVRPAKAVLVATQIIEQSLDIDFDVMVSELPPIDLLYQRVGRLHRHHRNRPETCAMPTLGLIETLESCAVPKFPDGHKWVYEEHILLKSWLALRARSELRIPQDIRADIETVYDDAAVSPADPTLKSLWESTAENLKKTKEKHLREANDRYLPSPWAGQRLDKLTEMGREEDDELHPFFQALTRLAARTVTAVCLFRLGEDLFYDKDHMRRVSLNQLPEKDGVAAILRRSCSIGDRRVLDSVESIPVPALWRKNALLRNCHPIDFDELGRHNFGKYSLVLSAETGLRVEKSPNAGI